MGFHCCSRTYRRFGNPGLGGADRALWTIQHCSEDLSSLLRASTWEAGFGWCKKIASLVMSTPMVDASNCKSSLHHQFPDAKTLEPQPATHSPPPKLVTPYHNPRQHDILRFRGALPSSVFFRSPSWPRAPLLWSREYLAGTSILPTNPACTFSFIRMQVNYSRSSSNFCRERSSYSDEPASTPAGWISVFIRWRINLFDSFSW